MSRLTNYKGDVMVEVTIAWEVEPKPDSLFTDALAKDSALELERSWICNDYIESVIVTKRGQTPPKFKKRIAQPLAGIDHKDRPICDLERGAYILGPINTLDLQALIDAAEVEVQLTWKYREIFDLILKEWQSMGSKTLANREDDDPLLAAIIETKHLGSKRKRVPFKYREQRGRAKVDAKIVDYRIDTLGGGPPAVQLVLELEISSTIKDIFARVICAADWSSLSAFKAKAPISKSTIPLGLRCCFLSIQNLVAATVNTSRGRTIFSSIVNANQLTPDAKDLVTSVRADLDKYIIAANHWGEARETMKSSDPVERYQARMSDFFGNLYEKYTLAAPVNIIRGMFSHGGGFGINLVDPGQPTCKTSLWLQLGVGHCGEHAQAGYDVLRQIMAANPTCPITTIIYSGNANIDHAFVLVNLSIDVVFETRVLNNENKLYPVGYRVFVFDLASALERPDNANALVHDAYLQFSRFEAKASTLLRSLRNKSKALRTTFVVFNDSYPASPMAVSSLDLSDDELRKEYPNI